MKQRRRETVGGTVNMRVGGAAGRRNRNGRRACRSPPLFVRPSGAFALAIAAVVGAACTGGYTYRRLAAPRGAVR